MAVIPDGTPTGSADGRSTPPHRTRSSRTGTGLRAGDLEIVFGSRGRNVPLRANTLLLHGPRRIVVDPSAREDLHPGLGGDDPILFFTHYHGDHRAAENRYPDGVETWASAPDAEAVGHPDEFLRRIDPARGPAATTLFRFLQDRLGLEPRTVHRSVAAGETIEAGGCRAELVALPGHTPGHVGLRFPEPSLLYTTDLDLTSIGPWYGNAASDLATFRRSIELARSIECDWYFTSHGERILDRATFLEKLDSFAAHFERRDTLILDLLADGERSVFDFVGRGLVYRVPGSEVPPPVVFFEVIHARKHLELLVQAGAVVADELFEHFALA